MESARARKCTQPRAECALQHLLESFLSSGVDAATFIEQLTPGSLQPPELSGQFTVACSAWPAALEFDRGPSRHQDPRPLVFPERYPKFDVFAAAATVPLMVSRGCPYGQCTFCSEANRDGTVIRTSDYGWVEDLAQRVPGAALYFQDSIFPGGNGSSSELLPTLQGLGREWGCQVYLPTLTEKRVAELAAHGCTYLYTGVELGAASVLKGINKPGITRSVVLERMRWIERHCLRLGISLMFGPMSVEGQLLETFETLQTTKDLARAIVDTGVDIAGFYPNVQTVLPGTASPEGSLHPASIWTSTRCPERRCSIPSRTVASASTSSPSPSHPTRHSPSPNKSPPPRLRFRIWLGGRGR